MARRRKGDAVSGWICLDKPHDLGSTQAVGRVRRAFNAQKAGHAGTLDPLATGVLPIALGEADVYKRQVTAPYDPAYGGREYSCRDLEGHVWSIGSYRGELG